jgi:hypothetical protein
MQKNILSTGRPVHVIADCYLAKQIGHKSDTIEHCFYSRDIKQTPIASGLQVQKQSAVKLRRPQDNQQEHFSSCLPKLPFVAFIVAHLHHFLFLAHKNPPSALLALLVSVFKGPTLFTDPAVTRLFLIPNSYARMNVNSQHALTVQDLMQALCDY